MAKTWKGVWEKRDAKARKSSLGFGQGSWGTMKGFEAGRRLVITADSVDWFHPSCLQT